MSKQDVQDLQQKYRPTTSKIHQYISLYTWGTFYPCSPNPSWVFAAKKLIFLVSSDHRSQSQLKFQSCLITEYTGVDNFFETLPNNLWRFRCYLTIFLRFSDPRLNYFLQLFAIMFTHALCVAAYVELFKLFINESLFISVRMRS